MATTLYRLAEESARIIYGGNIPVAGKVSLEELKISTCQVINQLLKTDYLQVNGRLGEAIPNGTVLALYENIEVTKWKNVSQCQLPIKPIKLPRNMGVFKLFDPDDPSKEYIPLQNGQWGLLLSQPLLNDLLGQCGYENYGMQIVFTKDITNSDPLNPTKVSMYLAIMDMSQYGDYDPLPVLPEMEWMIKKEVCALYGVEVTSDKVVDPGRKEQKGVPINQQTQS